MSKPPLTLYHQKQNVPLTMFAGTSWPTQFANPQQEYTALRDGAGLVDRSDLGVLELTGTDRVAFLHGLLSNDIQALPENHACQAGLLSPKGKVQAIGTVVHRADAHWIIAPRVFVPRMYDMLTRYLIAEDVQIVDHSTTYTFLQTTGPVLIADASMRTSPNLRWSLGLWDAVPLGGLGDASLGVPGVLCSLPSTHAVPFWNACVAAGAVPVGLEAWQMARVETGLAWYGVDADENCLLPETGWERSAVSYTKGCYLGQEIVARAANRGQVNRHLVGLKLKRQVPGSEGAWLPYLAGRQVPLPVELYLDGTPCGTITSAAYSPQHQSLIGITMLTRHAWTADEPLTLPDHPDVTAEPIDLPNLPRPT